MRKVGYFRVSDDSQVDGNSLAAQERLFYELCKSRGWQAVGIYREEGRSAHVDSINKRPVFKQLLEDAAKDKFDDVVVHTLDRWSRNLRVTLESLKILAQNDVGLISITENIDYSTPQGRLFIQMLGSFAEYFSGSLGTHVRKGQAERARGGRHLGGIPFGYKSCWSGKDGQRVLQCNPEHPGGVHQIEDEATAIQGLFERYARGTTSTGSLAIWLNEQGFRTRNTKRLPTADGGDTIEGRFFTNASVRVILHNSFYSGMVNHKKELFQGQHDPVISTELFETVQLALRKNSGRSSTIGRRPTRSYLLKGIARCAHCGMNLWAQTYQNGNQYYREHRASRSHGECPSKGGSISCGIPDEQIGKMFSSIVLPDDWERRVLAKIVHQDETARIIGERERVKEKLRRLGQAYVDGLIDEIEYRRQKKSLEWELESLLIPEVDSAKEAGRLLQDIPKLWAGATLQERHRLLTTVLDAVYVDLKGSRSIVSVKAKPAFKVVLGVTGESSLVDRPHISPTNALSTSPGVAQR
ncbi:recombinase family protein [Dehalococcoides mccartyi]|nr:recombinase family protein [Dehalococcoides mccartyi]